MKRLFLSLIFIAMAPFVRAHPHVFVDVGLVFQTDAAGQVTGVDVSWTYDPFFTLLVLADRGLDSDADLILTEVEQAELLGFDLMEWPDGFEGALFLRTPARDLDLGVPEAVSVSLVDGQLVTVHRRAVEPVAAKDLVAAPYDPFYYAALSLRSVAGLPEGCDAQIARADREEADAQVADMGDPSDEAFFEDARVGIYYADRLRITCAGS